MGTIKIDQIRIANFRGLKNFTMSLEDTTILTGMNNVGKTSVLKAMQVALGSSSFLTPQDFHIDNGTAASKIIIDIRIIPVNENGERQAVFSDEWEMQLKADAIKLDDDGMACVPLRTVVTYNEIDKSFEKNHFVLDVWEDQLTKWELLDNGSKVSIANFGIQFSYIDAHRDIMEDIRSRSSFIGKLLAEIPKSYNVEDYKAIEKAIEELNAAAVGKSDILNELQTTLKGIETTMEEKGATVKITPFTQKVRDLYKGVSIEYGTDKESLTLDYHGMGTRSWSSMLSFQAFLKLQQESALKQDKIVFPVIAIEEPESHLHPNAQKQLYSQMDSMPGQKLISTHSPSVVSQAKLEQIRGLYKKEAGVQCGMLDVSDAEMKRKIKQKVINTKGEIFFSKAIILVEGETEEQAIPALAKTDVEESKLLNYDFIGVGGYGQYAPFIIFANSFNIPWFVFSDGEQLTIERVAKALSDILGREIKDLGKEPNVLVIANGGDFEAMLIDEGYQDEVEKLIKLVKGDSFIDRHIRTNKNVDYSGPEGKTKAILDIMRGNKAKFASQIAGILEAAGKPAPTPIKTLLKMIDAELYG